jgi:hypothetical protein
MCEDAKARAKRLGFPTFSAYVTQLIRADLAKGEGGMLIEETPAPKAVEAKRTETVYTPAKKTARPRP